MTSSPIALLLCLLPPALGYVDRGILKLDNTTFDRIVDGSRPVFVRFDKEYSYGDEHDAWKNFAKTVGESSAALLTVDIGVSEYGDKDNSDLAERFGIKAEDFPQFRLWTKGSSSANSPLVYSGSKKEEELLRFVQEKAGVWIGLPGQQKELDTIAKLFGVTVDKDGLLKKAEALGLSDDAAKYYLKVMGKVATDSGFLAKETTRLKKMLEDGSVKPAKKEQFGRRLNVLSSFA